MAAYRQTISPMSAFACNADVDCVDDAHKKTRHKAGLSVFVVAGARNTNYMQIEIEPFPLVA